MLLQGSPCPAHYLTGANCAPDPAQQNLVTDAPLSMGHQSVEPLSLEYHKDPNLWWDNRSNKSVDSQQGPTGNEQQQTQSILSKT